MQQTDKGQNAGFQVRAGIVAAAVFLMMLPAVASAQSARPDTRNMTCEQAKALVKQKGSIVLSTGTHTFDRFVAHSGYCDRHAKNLRARYAQTKDDKKCPVGYACGRNRTNNSN